MAVKGFTSQWYAPDGRRGVFSLNITQQGPMNSPEFPTVLDAVGEWRFYMYHESSKGHTSANGNHFATGRAVPNPDSEWYNTYFKQYFTAVKITVMPQNPQDPRPQTHQTHQTHHLEILYLTLTNQQIFQETETTGLIKIFQ